jgi:hypothetical protein
MIITSEDVTEAPLDPMQIFGHQLLSWGMLTHILIKEHMKGISITIKRQSYTNNNDNNVSNIKPKALRA